MLMLKERLVVKPVRAAMAPVRAVLAPVPPTSEVRQSFAVDLRQDQRAAAVVPRV